MSDVFRPFTGYHPKSQPTDAAHPDDTLSPPGQVEWDEAGVASTFDHLLQMLPQNVTHKVGGQLQKTLLAQVTQHLAIHAKPLQVHVHQAELVGGPEEPLAHLLLTPQPGVCQGEKEVGDV